MCSWWGEEGINLPQVWLFPVRFGNLKLHRWCVCVCVFKKGHEVWLSFQDTLQWGTLSTVYGQLFSKHRIDHLCCHVLKCAEKKCVNLGVFADWKHIAARHKLIVSADVTLQVAVVAQCDHSITQCTLYIVCIWFKVGFDWHMEVYNGG